VAKAKLTVANDDIELEISAAISILNTLLRAGVRIDHRCGGHAQCGTCRCRIIHGAENLSPIGERERMKLAKFPDNDNLRLACQTYARGDVTIEIQSRQARVFGEE
jgi:ferredoxin